MTSNDRALNAATPQMSVMPALLCMIREGVAVFGTDGVMEYHNAAFARLTGQSDAALAEATLAWCMGLFAGDRSMPETADGTCSPDGIERAGYGRSPPPYLRRMTLGQRPVEIRTTSTPEGRKMLVVNPLDDTSYSSAERLLEALSLSPVPSLVLGPDDRVLMWNDAFLGLNPHSPLTIGMEFRTLLEKLSGQDQLWSIGIVEDRVAERLSRHANYAGPFEEGARSADGQEIWYLTSEHRLPDGTTLIIHTDITERKNAEAALRDALDQADRANQAKSLMLANVSHELRTPLNAIIGFSAILKNELLGPVGHARYLEYADDINQSGEHLLGLVNTMLDLARIDAGQFTLMEEAVDPAKEAVATLRLMEIPAAANRLTLEQRIEPGLPMLHCDRRALKQILLNLLSNAVDFTPDEGRIAVEMALNPAGGDLVVRIIDNGIGMREEDIPRALEPFGQIPGGPRTDRTGTGLGLPLVKALVERHGGTFGIETRFGTGTTVSLTFPADRLQPA